jgi:molybdopterin converting factor subunit 1
MIVHLRLFAALRERLGHGMLDWDLPEDASIDDLWRSLCAAHPGLESFGSSISFAVNQEYVDRSHRISEGDEVALIPPVSGG